MLVRCLFPRSLPEEVHGPQAAEPGAAISRGHNLFLIPTLSVVINPVVFRKLFLLDWMIYDCPGPCPVLPCTALAAACCSGERMGISSTSGLLQDGN